MNSEIGFLVGGILAASVFDLFNLEFWISEIFEAGQELFEKKGKATGTLENEELLLNSMSTSFVSKVFTFQYVLPWYIFVAGAIL